MLSTSTMPRLKSSGKEKGAWLAVILLWGVALLNYMDRQMLSTMRSAMEISIPELQNARNFGRLMAAFLWVYGIASPFSGWIADKFNKKWLIIASLFVWSAITFLMGYAHSFSLLYILRALMGISEALYIPAALSLIVSFHEGTTRALAIGVHMSGLYTGQALGGYGAGLANKYSWQTCFHGFGIVGVLYAVVLFFFLKNPPELSEKSRRPEPKRDFSARQVLGNGAFWILLIYFAVSSLPGWGVKNWLPTLVAANLHIGMEQAGPLSTISIAIASFLGVIIGGFASDKWIISTMRARIYISTIGLGLTIPALLLLGFGHSILFCLVAGCLFGIGYGMFDANNMPILCQFIGSHNRAFAYGLMNMTGVFAGAIVTELLGKATADGNLGLSFAWMSVALLTVIVICLLKLRPTQYDRQD